VLRPVDGSDPTSDRARDPREVPRRTGPGVLHALNKELASRAFIALNHLLQSSERMNSQIPSEQSLEIDVRADGAWLAAVQHWPLI